MNTTEICGDNLRRQLVRDHRGPDGKPDLNGIDFIETGADQRTLHIYFLSKAPSIKPANVIIRGGRRITGVEVTGVAVCPGPGKDLDDCMTLTVNKPGDFSDYTLCLVELDQRGRPTTEALRGFDPRFACIEFSFKVGCNTLDCLPREVCPPSVLPEPDINYLAKDYASFRQLILDRLSLIMPDWRERHVPDLGITLVELLAYTGDQLSYFQDAVATEAYLDTARQRISVRRHARLVDYRMHEGCNARAWVFIETHGNPPPLKIAEVAFLTGHNGKLPEDARLLSRETLRRLSLPQGTYDVFEAMGDKDIELADEHNEIHFYTWGGLECCLPPGVTRATLVDAYLPQATPAPAPDNCGNQPGQPPEPPKRTLNLKPGNVLIFEEVISPTTGQPADADRAHRHAVLLTSVTPGEDKLTAQPVVEIEWAAEDALPFPLCISAVSDAPKCIELENVSVARGNVVLVDHGRTIGRQVVDEDQAEDLGYVPGSEIPGVCLDVDCAPEVTLQAGRFGPRLKFGPLTFAQPPGSRGASPDCPPPQTSAASRLRQDVRQALPQITLSSWLPGSTSWDPRFDLLDSEAEDNQYVVEVDNGSRAHLRFGDGESGRMPGVGEHFIAVYRVGNGTIGNAGAGAISHIVLKNTLSGVQLLPRNPMASSGGTEPEPVEEVKLFAPYAFRAEPQRAITAEDYATLANRHPLVQRATASLRWTGAWYEVIVAIDPKGTSEVASELLGEVECLLRPFRRIGHEVKVVSAKQVPLNIGIHICVKAGYLGGHVKAELLDVFSNRQRRDGSLGFFHPDNLTFGSGIMLSRLVAAAQSVTGVENAIVTRLQRLNEPAGRELADGILRLGRSELARLDNDPSFPENGTIEFEMGGGR